MNLQIDNAMKRARGYWFVDGFIEIAMGILFIILAGFLLVSMNTSQMPLLPWFLSVTGEVVILKVASFLVVILILWWLKDNFTYPRTGFVRGKITLTQVFVIVKNLILFLLLPILGLLIASLLVTSTDSVLSSMPVWFPVGLGLTWAILIVLAGEWMGIHRFRLVGSAILLAGTGVGIWQLSMGLPNVPTNTPLTVLQSSTLESISRTLTSLDFILLICGAILIASGLVTFIRYRKENPTPYTEEA